MDFKNKIVTVVGLGKSGLASALLLHKKGAIVKVTEKNITPEIEKNCYRLNEFTNSKIKIQIGRHTLDFIKESELIVVSPGVKPVSEPIKWAETNKIKIISEVELGFYFCPGVIIAVTGTNGKSTVTTIIGEVLKNANKKVVVCGNIGNPLCGELSKIDEQTFVVLEISSFQLHRVDKFKPKIAAVLNLSQNHLDWHSDYNEYVNSKKKITINQNEDDFLILNINDKVVKDFAKQVKAKIIFFNGNNKQAVKAVISVLGIDEQVYFKTIAEFKGLEHRCEYVADINGVRFINDSKATTPAAVIYALENFDKDKKLILILGGKNKGADFSILNPYIKDRVKLVLLIGSARQEINKSLCADGYEVFQINSFEQAVTTAFSRSMAGDTILFSPGCASFDMFKNFEERGKIFKRLVLKRNLI